MVAEFDAAAFSLKKGQITGPIKTAFGYHVIKALSDPGMEGQSLEEAREDIKRILLVKKRKEKLNSLREGLEIKRLWDCKDPTSE